MQLDASFRTFRNLPALESQLDIERVQMNLDNMLKNPVYGKNKLKMHVKIRFPEVSSPKLATFLKSYREQIVSLEYRMNQWTNNPVSIIWDPYLISYPNLEELSFQLLNIENYHGFISWMLMKHNQSLQKLYILKVIFDLIDNCSMQ